MTSKSRKLSNVFSYLIATAVSIVFVVASYLLGPLYAFLGIVILTVVALSLWFSFEKPWLILFPISAGSFLGAIFHFFENLPLPGTLFQFFLIIGLSVYLLHSLHYHKFEITYSDLELPVWIFLSIIFISLVYSPGQEEGFYNAFRFVVLLVFVIYILNVVSDHSQSLRVMYLLVAVGVILASYAVGQYILNPEIAIQNMLSAGTSIERVSVTGLYEDPNRFAATLFIPISLTVAILFSELGYKLKLFSLILFLILCGGIVSSFSRSALISVGIILLVTIISTRKWKQATLFSFLILTLLLIVPDFRSALMITVERIFEVLFGVTDDSSGIRMMLGKAAVWMFFDTYMLGVGFDGFAARFTDYYTLQESIGVQKPHNIIYRIAAELGLFGLLTFLYIVYLLLKTAHKNIKSASKENEKVLYISLLTSFYAYLMFYQFYGGGLTDSNLMLIIGFILAGRNIFDSNTKISDEESK